MAASGNDVIKIYRPKNNKICSFEGLRSSRSGVSLEKDLAGDSKNFLRKT
jgi:hypothetical protein